MKSILWFGNIGANNSFSRITESMLPLLKDHYDITLLTNTKNSSSSTKLDKIKIVNMGSDTRNITLDEYLYAWVMNRDEESKHSLECMVKYSIIQITELIDEFKFDYLVVCNGIYESKYIVDIIGVSSSDILKNTKLVVWTPIDYIPTYECVRDLFYCDYLITMTSVMSDILKNLSREFIRAEGREFIRAEGREFIRAEGRELAEGRAECIIDWVGHGSEIVSINDHADREVENRKALIKKMNSLHSVMWVGPRLEVEDIIILNANNFVPRKRIDLTLLLFMEFIRSQPKDHHYKLWIHTDLKKLNEFLVGLDPIDLNFIRKHMILSNNNVSNEDMKLIYKTCQIGIQTSTGEGWSLTNCEHKLYNKKSIQIVPDFLATGLNFANGKGVLLPVKLVKSINEEGKKIIVGEIKVKESLEILKKINVLEQVLAEFTPLTWKECADRFVSIIK